MFTDYLFRFLLVNKIEYIIRFCLCFCLVLQEMSMSDVVVDHICSHATASLPNKSFLPATIPFECDKIDAILETVKLFDLKESWATVDTTQHRWNDGEV